jgi:hypothetical protein
MVSPLVVYLIRSPDHWTEPVTVDDEFALMSSNWNE